MLSSWVGLSIPLLRLSHPFPSPGPSVQFWLPLGKAGLGTAGPGVSCEWVWVPPPWPLAQSALHPGLESVTKASKWHQKAL